MSQERSESKITEKKVSRNMCSLPKTTTMNTHRIEQTSIKDKTIMVYTKPSRQQCFLPSLFSSEYRPDPIWFEVICRVGNRHVEPGRQPEDLSNLSGTNIPLCRSDISGARHQLDTTTALHVTLHGGACPLLYVTCIVILVQFRFDEACE